MITYHNIMVISRSLTEVVDNVWCFSDIVVLEDNIIRDILGCC